MLSIRDYAGSGYRICQAVNGHTTHKAVLYSGGRPRFNYPWGLCPRANKEQLIADLEKADVIHWKGDTPASDTFFGVKVPKKPTVITIGGSGFRRHGNKNIARATYTPQDYKADLITVNTPDLNYPDLGGVYTPLPIDSKKIKADYMVGCCNRCGTKIPFTVSHSPSSREKKGTETIIKAFDRLDRMGVVVRLDLIENDSYHACVERKSKATMFIDNITTMGHYCNSAVEAMQYGVPVICYVSPEAIKQSGGILDDHPVVNCKTKSDVFNTIRHFRENPRELTGISQKTKSFCDRHHSYEAVASMWGKLYSQL